MALGIGTNQPLNPGSIGQNSAISPQTTGQGLFSQIGSGLSSLWNNLQKPLSQSSIGLGINQTQYSQPAGPVQSPLATPAPQPKGMTATRTAASVAPKSTNFAAPSTASGTPVSLAGLSSGFTSTDPAIQAKLAQMSQQAQGGSLATPAPSTVNSALPPQPQTPPPTQTGASGVTGATSGASSPTGSASGLPNLLSLYQPTPAMEAARQSVLSSLTPTQQELDLQNQINALNTQAASANINEAARAPGTPLDIVRGKASMDTQLINSQKQTLLDQLTVAQSARQAQAQQATAALGFTTEDLNNLRSILAPQTVGGSEVQYNPQTGSYNTLYQAPVTLAPGATLVNPNTGSAITGMAASPDQVASLATQLVSTGQAPDLQTARNMANQLLSGNFQGGVTTAAGSQSPTFASAAKDLTSLGFTPAEVNQLSSQVGSMSPQQAQSQLQQAVFSKDKDLGTLVSQSTSLANQLQNLGTQLQTAGSGIIPGTIENIAEKAGQTTNPQLAQINSNINQAIADYREAIKATRFSSQIQNFLGSQLPSITNSPQLNSSIISGILNGLSTSVNSTLQTSLPNSYSTLFPNGALNVGSQTGTPDAYSTPPGSPSWSWNP